MPCLVCAALTRVGAVTPDADVDGFFSREDMFKFWHATHAYAQAVVDGLYDSDADVVADEALQTMASDLGEGGAQIRGAPTEFRDKATLVRFITNIIFTCTAEHNSVNFPQLRYYGFIPNRPCTPHAGPVHCCACHG